MRDITLIYDGNCQLCKNSVAWVVKKLSLTAISYQMAELSTFDLTLAECEKQVYVIADGKKFAGITAVIFLLQRRGNKVLAFLLRLSGPAGAFGYKQVANNRNSIPVKALSRFIAKLT